MIKSPYEYIILVLFVCRYIFISLHLGYVLLLICDLRSKDTRHVTVFSTDLGPHSRHWAFGLLYLNSRTLCTPNCLGQSRLIHNANLMHCDYSFGLEAVPRTPGQSRPLAWETKIPRWNTQVRSSWLGMMSFCCCFSSYIRRSFNLGLLGTLHCILRKIHYRKLCNHSDNS